MVKFHVCSLTHHFCWLKQVKHVKTICLMTSPSFAGRSNKWFRFLQFHDVPQCSTLHRNLTYFLRHSSFKLICLGKMWDTSILWYTSCGKFIETIDGRIPLAFKWISWTSLDASAFKNDTFLVSLKTNLEFKQQLEDDVVIKHGNSSV